MSLFSQSRLADVGEVLKFSKAQFSRLSTANTSLLKYPIFLLVWSSGGNPSWSVKSLQGVVLQKGVKKTLWGR